MIFEKEAKTYNRQEIIGHSEWVNCYPQVSNLVTDLTLDIKRRITKIVKKESNSNLEDNDTQLVTLINTIILKEIARNKNNKRTYSRSLIFQVLSPNSHLL